MRSDGEPVGGEIGEGLTNITLEVREPIQEQAAVTHKVHMQDFRQWLSERPFSRPFPSNAQRLVLHELPC